MADTTQQYDSFGNITVSLATPNLPPPDGLISDPISNPTSPTSILSGQTVSQLSIADGFLQSSNFVTGSTGWQVKANGDAEFNNGTFRGTVSASAIVNAPVVAMLTAGQGLKTGEAVFVSDGTENGLVDINPLDASGAETDIGNSDAFGENKGGQSFVAPATDTITSIKIYLKKVGLPTDNITVGIQGDSGGSPSGTYISSSNVAGSGLTTTETETSITVSAPITGGTTYWIVLQRTGSLDNTNYYRSYRNTTSSYASIYKDGKANGTWQTATGAFLEFKLHTATMAAGTVGRTTAFLSGYYQSFIGFVRSAVSAGATATIDVGGFTTTLSGLATASQYYLKDTSAGTIGTSAGTNTRKVGIATSSTTLAITNIF